MVSVRRLAILVGLFVLQAIGTAMVGQQFDALPYTGTRQLRNLPLGGWTDRDIEDEMGLLDQLKADVSLFKVYTRPGVPPVTVYVGYYDRLQGSALSHAPQVCFTSQGWKLMENRRISVRPEGEAFSVSELVVAKQSNRQLAYYWYQSRRHRVPDLFQLKLRLLVDRVRSGGEAPQGNAFVRISTDLGDDRSGDEQRLAEFMEQFLPQLRAGFFGEGVRNDG